MARNAYIKTTNGWEQIAGTTLAVPSGLVPLVPTGGTNISYTADGTITFSAVSSFEVDGVFSAAYENYLVQIYANGGGFITTQYTISGAADAGATTYQHTLVAISGSTTTWTNQKNSTGTTSHNFMYGSGTLTNDFSIDIYRPFVSTSNTVFVSKGTYGSAIQVGGGSTTTTASYDGMKFTVETGTMTGSMKIYGYSKGSLTQPQVLQPYAYAAGTVAANATNGSTSAPLFWDASKTVTFPVGRFSQTPIVTVAATGSGQVTWAQVDSVSGTTSFIVRTIRVGAYPTTANIVQWQAVQMTSTNATG